ncbi:GNAT family N-acetyltransferase [Nonomuraea phyllanthi]|uniref:GNAT family N-acetyltransferase n=1 Tax=Nonomuraea phyllanthi TaxID=2219224 RepID=A0A5C4WHM3_9ACTN|nr:GNAT family N-acetyltransferase [Nonomuraea phyllanthi]KAB8194005.1 GNAT family N-acetyltransferase [Nonomuraea phyllanthi]
MRSGFTGGGDVRVVVSPGSWMCPPGWVGVVVLGGACLATVPVAGLVEPVRAALLDLHDADLARLPERLRALEELGPATLAYLDAEDFNTAQPGVEVECLTVGHPVVRRLLDSVAEEDAEESGLAEVSSAAFVVREGGRAVAASGYRPWLEMAAHLSVLTAPGHRGRGLARRAASAAVADALAAGLLPQWRARPEPSRRVARALGFRQHGAQLSVRLG